MRKRLSREQQIALAKSNAPEGSIFNDEDGHCFVEINGEAVEMKWCRKCKSWHPLSEFYPCKNAKPDGMNPWCKACVAEYYLNYNNKKSKKTKSGNSINPVKKEAVMENKSCEDNEILTKLNSILSSYIKSINDSYKNKIESLERKIKMLETAASKMNDVNSLSDTEFEKMVMARKHVQPRVYFNAIHNLDVDDRFTIQVYDKTTDFTTIIKR